MVNQIRDRGIMDERVLAAMSAVERHHFVDQSYKNRAYEDSALPINNEQTISQPYTVALMSEALMTKPGDKILEIGTGSGYQAVILAMMGCRVFTIERQMDLFVKARKIFDRLKLPIVSQAGDGSIGWSEFAPYNGIIVTAGAPAVPEPLKKQLTDGARLVIPVGGREIQKMVIIRREKEKYSLREVDGFKFVPLIGKEGWK